MSANPNFQRVRDLAYEQEWIDACDGQCMDKIPALDQTDCLIKLWLALDLPREYGETDQELANRRLLEARREKHSWCDFLAQQAAERAD